MANDTDTGMDPAAAAERYLAFWNAATPEEQRRLAPEAFTEDVGYHAPVGVMTGTEALIEFRTGFTEHMGAVSFTARREPEAHHDRVRLLWGIRTADGTPFAEGTDVLTVAPDGRVTSVTTFLDRAPEGFDPHAHG